MLKKKQNEKTRRSDNSNNYKLFLYGAAGKAKISEISMKFERFDYCKMLIVGPSWRKSVPLLMQLLPFRISGYLQLICEKLKKAPEKV